MSRTSRTPTRRKSFYVHRDDWHRTVNKVELKGIPILRITDVQVAKQFYGEFLGFKVDWEHYYAEDAPVYMQMSRDGLVLHLSENDRFARGSVVFVETTGIDALHDELSQKPGPWTPPGISSTPWQTKQMELADPFGNLLRFNENNA